MLLYLLRHADAQRLASSDSQRMLTDKGLAQAERVGRFCKHQEIVPERILASPFARARQTAKIVAAKLGIEAEEAPFLASGMQPEGAIRELRASYSNAASLMLVGHEPDLSRLVAFLAGGLAIEVKKASLTALQTDSLRHGASSLLFSIPPRLLPP
jgi:phosphohistidine phosphatase